MIRSLLVVCLLPLLGCISCAAPPLMCGRPCPFDARHYVTDGCWYRADASWRPEKMDIPTRIIDGQVYHFRDWADR